MELNPSHPVTTQMRDQWHKFCAILLVKMGKFDVEITAEDIVKLEQMFPGEMPTMIVDEVGGKIRLRLMPERAARAEAKRKGDL